MVDLVVLQSASYVAAAIGVCVAGFYYVMNLRETMRNRKVALTSNLVQTFTSEEGLKRHVSLLNMEWTDWGDFLRKYDSKVNEENFVMRASFVSAVNYISYLVKQGLLDIGSVYEVCGETIMENWLKFQPIYLNYVEKGDWGRDIYDNLDYIAKIMVKMKAVRDPKFRGSAADMPPDAYDRIMKSLQ